jgi:hypothetical protein
MSTVHPSTGGDDADLVTAAQDQAPEQSEPPELPVAAAGDLGKAEGATGSETAIC